MKYIEVVAAVITERDKFLITQRVGGQFDGMWEYPGGKIEHGESHHEALEREIKEELDVEIGVDTFLATITYAYETFHLTMHLYYSHVISGELTLNEHASMRWINLNEAKNIYWVPADVQVLELIEQSGYFRR